MTPRFIKGCGTAVGDPLNSGDRGLVLPPLPQASRSSAPVTSPAGDLRADPDAPPLLGDRTQRLGRVFCAGSKSGRRTRMRLCPARPPLSTHRGLRWGRGRCRLPLPQPPGAPSPPESVFFSFNQRTSREQPRDTHKPCGRTSRVRLVSRDVCLLVLDPSKR